MKEGSVEALDKCLQEHQIRFIQAGTYLLLEKLKNSVYRRLFRRVAVLHKEQEPAKAAQVPLGAPLLSSFLLEIAMEDKLLQAHEPQ